MGNSDVLVIVHGGVAIPFSAIEELVEIRFQSELGQSQFADIKILDQPQETPFKKAVCFLSEPFSLEQCNSLRKILEHGARAVIHLDAEHIQTLRRNCVLSGFLVGQQSADEQDVLEVTKPEWEVGAKSAVKQEPSTAWTLDVNDDDELLDDEEYLEEEDMKPAPIIASGKVPVKKACANCSCGLAEGKEAKKLTPEMLNNPVTSCGSCGLGDAYRCASCPYRGLPSFEPGKKIELPEGFLVSDL